MSLRILPFFLLLATGCSHNVYSPPARLVALQGPEALGEGRTAVAGELLIMDQVFGAPVRGGAVRARHGVSPDLELVGEAAMVRFDDSEGVETDQDPGIYSARVGTKWSPEGLGHHLALTAGLGGGGHTAGGFIAPDLGFVVGYQNPYLVPFYGMEGGVSVPLAASAVDTSRNDEEVGAHVDTPITTFSVRSTLGMRIPLVFGWDGPGALVLGAQHIYLVDTDGEDDSWLGLAGQLEVIF